MSIEVANKYNQIPNEIFEFLNEGSEDLLKKKIGYDTKKLWTEFQLIIRLIYRSKNQHRASFSFQHLNEIKRLGVRIGKAELWLKANFVENGEKLFDFIGFLNTLIILIEKTINACDKTFYLYSHYLEQGLFVPLALVVIATVGTINYELIQWKKYSRLLYFTLLDKLKIQNGNELVFEWCKTSYLESKNPEKSSTDSLIPKRIIPSILETAKSSNFIVKKNYRNYRKKEKITTGDEIDDIFNNI